MHCAQGDCAGHYCINVYCNLRLELIFFPKKHKNKSFLCFFSEKIIIINKAIFLLNAVLLIFQATWSVLLACWCFTTTTHWWLQLFLDAFLDSADLSCKLEPHVVIHQFWAAHCGSRFRGGRLFHDHSGCFSAAVKSHETRGYCLPTAIEHQCLF